MTKVDALSTGSDQRVTRPLLTPPRRSGSSEKESPASPPRQNRRCISCANPMSHEAAKSETTALRNLGRKIGIAGLATPDFDLVCANAHAVASFCDQFESIELTPKERFYFMQLIVASLDEALRRGVAICSRIGATGRAIDSPKHPGL